MKSVFKFSCVLAMTCGLGVPAALAQPQNGGMKMQRYDVATETNITGTIQDVVQTQRGRLSGTHLVVKTETGTIEVHLGPSSFLVRQGFSFAKGDTIEVVGSKMTVSGREAVVAREVSKDDKKLILRDKTGRPLWAGRPT